MHKTLKHSRCPLYISSLNTSFIPIVYTHFFFSFYSWKGKKCRQPGKKSLKKIPLNPPPPASIDYTQRTVVWPWQLWFMWERSFSQPSVCLFWSSRKLCTWSGMVLTVILKYSGLVHSLQAQKNLLKISLHYDGEQKLVNGIIHYF